MALDTLNDAALAPPRPLAGGRARIWWRRFALLGESWPAMIGVGIVVFWIVVAALAPLIAPYPPNANDYQALASPFPSAKHLLGTDHLGRDILSRIVWGARTVLTVAPIAVLGATASGSLLGL